MNSSEIIIAVVGYIIVFIALIVLFLFFSLIPKLVLLRQNLLLKRKNLLTGKKHKEYTKHITGQENAAIATAIFLYFSELHDIENSIMTIKKIKKDYSPWSSKIHNINMLKR